VSLRYFNAAGATLTAKSATAPAGNPSRTARCRPLWGRAQIDIYGTDYPTPDGTAIRDYIHVRISPRLTGALEHLADGGESAALNLGTGRGHSVREVVRVAEAVSGRPIAWRDTARRPGDPPVLVADPSLAAELLGWRARVSDLETILRTALAWQMSLADRSTGSKA
jgi:UDP-glucose 4-epimerase